MEKQVGIFKMLDVVGANLRQIRKDLGNTGWERFKEDLISVSNLLKGKNLDRPDQQAKNELWRLTDRFDCIGRLLDNTAHGTVRTRGVISATKQINRSVTEGLLSQRTHPATLYKRVSELLSEIQKIDSENDQESRYGKNI
jgi:hypothetical protein